MKALFITDPALLFQLSEIMKKSLITLVFNNIILCLFTGKFKTKQFLKKSLPESCWHLFGCL